VVRYRAKRRILNKNYDKSLFQSCREQKKSKGVKLFESRVLASCAPVAPTATRLVARTFFLVNNATNLSEP
jgi:hypothetical protein